MNQKVTIGFDGKEKKVRINANEYPRLTPLLGAFPSILAEPNDLSLITSSPSERRRFLNLHLAQSDPLYVHHFTRFWRAMKQRNCLLKAKNRETLDCWESEMASSAAYLFLARRNFLAEIGRPLQEQSHLLTENKECVSIVFQSAYPSDPELYRAQLKKTRKREEELGLTLHGPHRDDLLFLINGKEAKTFGSEGQKRTIVTALRFAEWKHLAQKTDTIPFMSMDDFGGALDLKRQQKTEEFLLSLGQVFITTPSDPPLFQKAKRHLISQGVLYRK